MAKRTHASITDEPCSCKYLQDAANDPDSPIEFDSETAEYQFKYGTAMLVIYHCPFCGGAAPKSKRSSLFAQIPRDEEERLAKMMDGIQTIDDAIRRFGNPDFEGESRTECPEKEDEAPTIWHHRDVRYQNFSDVAEIWITERTDGLICWHLQGKFIGKNSNDVRS